MWQPQTVLWTVRHCHTDTLGTAPFTAHTTDSTLCGSLSSAAARPSKIFPTLATAIDQTGPSHSPPAADFAIMATATTHYSVLAIPRHSDLATVQAAYRRLSLLWHPDKSPPQHRLEAEEHFKRVVAAYECLGDTDRKQRYDAELELDSAHSANPSSPSAAAAEQRQQREQHAERAKRNNEIRGWFQMQAYSWPNRAPHHPWTRALDSPFVRLESNPDWVGCVLSGKSS